MLSVSYFLRPKWHDVRLMGERKLRIYRKNVEGNVLNMTWIVRLIEKIKNRQYYEKEFKIPLFSLKCNLENGDFFF